MASWLKAAEDLFEVVDRRAKLVASELSEEQPGLKPSERLSLCFISQVYLNFAIQHRPRPAYNGSPNSSNIAKEHPSTQASAAENMASDKDRLALSSENAGDESSNDAIQTGKELQFEMKKEGTSSDNPSVEKQPNDFGEHNDSDKILVTATTNALEAVEPSINSESTAETTLNDHETSASDFVAVQDEGNNRDIPIDSDPDKMSRDGGASLKLVQEGLGLESAEKIINDDNEVKDDSVKEESISDAKKQQEKIDQIRVQDQLDEAQGLLKTTVSTGQSKEARLAKVCAGLSSRVQEYKSENAQLEELISVERKKSESYESDIKKLRQDLSASKVEVARVEANMVEALAAKNSEIASLVSSLDATKKQSAESEGKLGSLQALHMAQVPPFACLNGLLSMANMESIMRNRELTETRMMQALREELASAERRAEEERASHNSTKMRMVDERTSRAADLEQKLAVLEAENASLSRELQDMEARARRGQKRSIEEANQALQAIRSFIDLVARLFGVITSGSHMKVQAWQEEVERARQGQRDAESKVSSLEAEVQKMRVEMAGMKRDAEHYSRQEHMELEKRYRELTDLLYHKQTQLEAMASEKAAVEFQLEKEVKRLQEAQVETDRSRVPRRASSSWDVENDLKALDPTLSEPMDFDMISQRDDLGLVFDDLVGLAVESRLVCGPRVSKDRHVACLYGLLKASPSPSPAYDWGKLTDLPLQLEKAVKLLDSGAVRATRFLWRYPIARVILLFYLVFVHLFLMYLMHRLQIVRVKLEFVEILLSIEVLGTVLVQQLYLLISIEGKMSLCNVIVIFCSWDLDHGITL
ncbi:hypothetical protein Syun_026094 [Stephania yunnanensis]|uniref:Golgin candidate 1 n=1 Tax=Stephania yunnanensis TaxID=152371 RepID=A0AAP0ETC0_9MAGN